jgi:hypothetical protein
MIHNLPTLPAFQDGKPGDPIQEMALRVVVELPNWEFQVMGTAVLIGGYLGITARHVLDAVNQRFGSSCELVLWQVLPSGPTYRLWNVMTAWRCPTTDIALLHLASAPRIYSTVETPIEWKTPRLRAAPPSPGEKVVAFGYREGSIAVAEDANGVHHIELNDIGTTSAGEVGQVFPERRDASMLTFPCFEVRAQFDHGMSGGLVVDENGALCGLICAGYKFDDPQELPLSYAATLWPMLMTTISADRGDNYPRGIRYPVIDLALGGQISVTDLDRFDANFFPGRSLR